MSNRKHSLGQRPSRPPAKRSKWELQRRKRVLRHWAPAAVLVAGVSLAAAAVLVIPPAAGPADACSGLPRQAAHYHAHLTFSDLGKNKTAPANIGIDRNLTKDHTLDLCSSGHLGAFSPLHTHAGDPGTIHIETVVERNFTLGEFFRVWGKPIGSQQTVNMTAGGGHELHMFVDGTESHAWGDLVLRDQQTIVIRYT